MKSWDKTFQEEKVMLPNIEMTCEMVCQRHMSWKDRYFHLEELDDAGLGRPWRGVGFILGVMRGHQMGNGLICL